MNIRKITKAELQKIFFIAWDMYKNEGQTKFNLNNQEFITMCYLVAASNVLKLDIEFKEELSIEPV